MNGHANFDEATMILIDIDLEDARTPRPGGWPLLAKEQKTLVMLDPTHRRARAFATYDPRATFAPTPAPTPRPSAAPPVIDPPPLYFGHFTACQPQNPELDPTRWFAFVCGFLVTVLAWAIFIKAPPAESFRRAHVAAAVAPANTTAIGGTASALAVR